METLKQIFSKFLADQDQRLKERTYSNYEQVMELLEHYMNSYALNHLEKKQNELYEEKREQEDKEYSEIFGIEKITASQISEFLGFFMIKKVMSSKALINNTGTVLRRFATWLEENSYIDNKQFDRLFDTINELKDDILAVKELADLLSEEAEQNDVAQYEIYKESNYIISRIRPGRIWVEDYLNPDNEVEEIGPIKVSEKISDLAREDWSVYLELGKKNVHWHIIGSGKVYPAS